MLHCFKQVYNAVQKPRKRNITLKVAPMDKSTFSILFIMQKGKPNAEGNAPIFARITINHQMTHLATRSPLKCSFTQSKPHFFGLRMPKTTSFL